MEQNRFIQPFVPTYAPLPERTPSLMEKLSTAKMFVDDTGMGWSYAPPKADGFWQSQYTRREWMYLEMPGGLTGRHMGAEQQMERLSDPSAALTEMGKDEDRARSFIGTTVPFAARYDIDEKWAEKDEDFNPEDNIKFIDPMLMRVAEQQDPDIQAKLGKTSNQLAFNYVLNSTLKKKQLTDQIEADNRAAFDGGWTAATTSALVNYIALNEDTTRTLGFGLLAKGAAAGVRSMGKGAERLGKAMELQNTTYRAVTKAAQEVSTNPMRALQSAINTHMGASTAAVMSGSVIGGAFDVGMQLSNITIADALYGPDQTEVVYNPLHTLGAVGAGAALGWGLVTGLPRLAKVFRRKDVDRDYLPDDIAAMVEDGTLSANNLARQYADDVAMTRVNERLANIALDSELPVTMGWAVSREYLESRGRTVDGVSAFLDALVAKADKAGVKLDEGSLNGALEAYMRHGEAATQAAAGDLRAIQARVTATAKAQLLEANGDIDHALSLVRSKRVVTNARRVARELPDDAARSEVVSEINRLYQVLRTTKSPSRRRDIEWEMRRLSDKHGLTQTALVRGSESASRSIAKPSQSGVPLVTRESESTTSISGRIATGEGGDLPIDARLLRALEEETEEKMVELALLAKKRDEAIVGPERDAVQAEFERVSAVLDDLENETAERADAMADYFATQAVADATARREAVKVFTDPKARETILKYSQDPEAFAEISPEHAKLGNFLTALVERGDLRDPDAALIRAIFSQSDAKVLANTSYTSNLVGWDRQIEAVYSRMPGGPTLIDKVVHFAGRDRSPSASSFDLSRTLVHELLHAGLFSTPGLRSEFIKMHQKLIRSPRALAKARAFYFKYMEEVNPRWALVSVKEQDAVSAYFINNADEFFAEFGSMYIMDSKFRNLLVEAIDDAKHPLYKLVSIFEKAIQKTLPFLQEFEFGFSAKETQKFFSMVDQAMGFKPVARRKYLFAKETTSEAIRSTVYAHAVGTENQISRLSRKPSAETRIFELLDKIEKARADGKDALADKLAAKLQRVYAAKRGVSDVPFYRDMPRADREAALNSAFERIVETQADVVTGSNAVSRVLLGTRLGKAISNIVTDKQGLPVTMFSKLKELRAITSMFDVGRWGMQQIGTAGPKNLQGAKNWALREFEPVAAVAQRLRVKAGSEKAFQEANAEIVKTLAAGKNTVSAEHPFAKEMNEFIDMWTRYMSKMGERGNARGLIRDLAEDAYFMPLRLDPAKIRGREREFRDKLSAYWLEKYVQDADDTPLSTNVMRDTLKWFSQSLDKNGRPTGPMEINLSIFPNGKLPSTRGELRALGGDLEWRYANVLTLEVPELGGLTALEHAAQNYIRRQLGEEGFTGGVREFNKRLDQGRFARSDLTQEGRKRRFTQREIFLDNPDLAEFYNTNLYELGYNYANTTGFRIHAQGVLDDFMGVKGVTWVEFLNTMEQRLRDKYGGKPGSDYEIGAGFEKLHEVLADLSGGLPHGDSAYNRVSSFGAEFARQGALTAYGSGIGTTILGVENMWSIFSKVHSPVDLIDNIAVLVKSYLPGLRSKAVREELEGTVMGLKRMQQHAANRFVTGSAEGPGTLHWMDSITKPWKTAIDTITGHITPGHGQSRAGASVLRTMEALGQTAQTIGLNRVFNETGWVLQAHSTRREFNRYFDRALKLADSLLDTTRPVGTQEELAKFFKGKARKAGFGDRWDIARRLDESNLLSREKLEILQKLRERTPDKGLSSADLREAVFALPKSEQDAAFNVLDDFNNYLETEVLKRISEASSLYKTTDKASRTFVGSVMNSMFSFSRSFYSNQVLDAPGMPSRVFLGMVGSYMFFEILTAVTRGVLDGEDPDVIAERWKNDPVGELLSGGARVPLLGAFSAIPRYAIDSTRKALGNDEVKSFGYSPYQSAATGAMERMVKTGEFMFNAPIKWASGEEDVEDIGSDLWEHSRTFIPGAGSFYGELIQMTLDDQYGER